MALWFGDVLVGIYRDFETAAPDLKAVDPLEPFAKLRDTSAGHRLEPILAALHEQLESDSRAS